MKKIERIEIGTDGNCFDFLLENENNGLNLIEVGDVFRVLIKRYNLMVDAINENSSNKRKLLIDFTNEMQMIGLNNFDDPAILVDVYLKNYSSTGMREL